MDLAILIVISSIACRGACAIVNNHINGIGVLYNPQWTTTSGGYKFVSVYMFAAIPILLSERFITLWLDRITNRWRWNMAWYANHKSIFQI